MRNWQLNLARKIFHVLGLLYAIHLTFEVSDYDLDGIRTAEDFPAYGQFILLVIANSFAYGLNRHYNQLNYTTLENPAPIVVLKKPKEFIAYQKGLPLEEILTRNINFCTQVLESVTRGRPVDAGFLKKCIASLWLMVKDEDFISTLPKLNNTKKPVEEGHAHAIAVQIKLCEHHITEARNRGKLMFVKQSAAPDSKQSAIHTIELPAEQCEHFNGLKVSALPSEMVGSYNRGKFGVYGCSPSPLNHGAGGAATSEVDSVGPKNYGGTGKSWFPWS
ncbi:MAG: hypothetical protein K0U12_06395 [Gammaproteobacteria bacterium]|nr:hypothetical protein [Gammaproteobacteria bacterium]